MVECEDAGRVHGERCGKRSLTVDELMASGSKETSNNVATTRPSVPGRRGNGGDEQMMARWHSRLPSRLQVHATQGWRCELDGSLRGVISARDQAFSRRRGRDRKRRKG